MKEHGKTFVERLNRELKEHPLDELIDMYRKKHIDIILETLSLDMSFNRITSQFE